jgi:aminodeoxyfutalosine deaminase
MSSQELSTWRGVTAHGELPTGPGPATSARDTVACVPTQSPDPFISGLPKVELHVHLQGAASVDTVLELSRRHPAAGLPTERDALMAFYRFTDFAHFIEVYIAVNRLVRSPDDVHALVVGLARDLVAQQVRYAEVTVTPYSHLLHGMPGQAVADALTAGRAEAARLGTELAWVFDIPGEAGLVAADQTTDWVESYAPDGSVGFGLGGPEIGVPRPQFAPYFQRASALGLVSLPHAGETTGPETVSDALNVLNDIALEVCPTSNVCTRAVDGLESHPWPVLAEAGVPLTLNSDDPGMFSTSLNQEYEVAQEHFGLTSAGLADLVRSAIRYSLATDSRKQALLAEVAAYVNATPARSTGHRRSDVSGRTGT